jgi:hypothetical protein
MVSEI